MSPTTTAKRAQVAERRTRAIELRLAGTDWQTVADTLGYSDRGAAHKDVTRALKANLAAEAEQIEEMRYTVGLRLEQLQSVMWPKAVKGDARAADTCLKIIQQWCKLYGLEAPTQVALTHRIELEGQIVADAIAAALDAIRLPEEQRVAALEAAQRHLTESQPTDGP